MRATRAEPPISKVLGFCVRNLQEAQTDGSKIRLPRYGTDRNADNQFEDKHSC